MASAAKTKDFAEDILEYMRGGTPLPLLVDNKLYIALLSAIPADVTSVGPAPYAGSEVALCEVSAGNYRVALGTGILGTIAEDNDASAMRLISDGGEITWPDAPANFNVSGYCLCSSPTATTSVSYLAYELFDGTNKTRQINAGDSIKINTNGLVIKEK